jgi:hypothetical protein
MHWYALAQTYLSDALAFNRKNQDEHYPRKHLVDNPSQRIPARKKPIRTISSNLQLPDQIDHAEVHHRERKVRRPEQ